MIIGVEDNIKVCRNMGKTGQFCVCGNKEPMCLHCHQTEMQDSTGLIKVKHRKKKELLNSSGNSSSPASIDLEHNPESSLVIVRQLRKKRKNKHRTCDLGNNEKHLRHRHHHHRHGHSSRVKEGRVHKRICPVHEVPLKAVRVKKEPLDGDNGSSSEDRHDQVVRPNTEHQMRQNAASCREYG